MGFSAASLEPVIYRILTAPGTDLSTISAKRVRRQLADEQTLSVESIKENREGIDALITKVFDQVSAEQQQRGAESDEGEDSAGEESHTSRKRQHRDEDDDDEEEDRESPPPTKKAKKASTGKQLSDEALARKLSNEINGGRTTRTGKSATGGKARGSSKAKAKKSAATIDSDEDSDDGAASKKKKPRKRASSSTAGGGGAKGGFQKEFVLSGALSTVVHAEKMSRPQVVKQLWVYIKDNELQNPSNKKEIICDSNLKAVFGKDKIDMFAMNKVLGQHLHEPES